MAALSLRELAQKLNYALAHDPEVDKNAMIRDSWVCNRDTRDYPEGTVIFETISNNATIENMKDSTHLLTIYPSKLGRIN